MHLTTILCPVDFSDTSGHGVEWALALARHSGASVAALHAVPPIAVPGPGAGEVTYRHEPGLTEAERIRLERQVRATFDAAGAAEVPIRVFLDMAAPASAILAHAERLHASVIVMGTHGAGGFERFVLGSVAEKVLRKARCPVLTVPPRAESVSRLPFTRVLCAVDFSEPSLRALEHAVSLVRDAGATLVAAHVVEWPWPEPPPPPIDDVPPAAALQLRELRAHRETMAAERLRALSGAAGQPVLRVAHGKSYVELLRIADAEKVDLIVVGVHGRNPVDLALFGSTANQIVRRALCPVLTIRS